MKTAVVKIMLFGTALFSIFSCSKEIPDAVSPPPTDNVPRTPGNLTATTGDRTIFLTWAMSDTQGVQFYRVYRSDSTDNDYKLMSDVNQTSYTSINLRNGLAYYFRVSSVNYSGFEGYRSLAVRAVPNLYGLVINGGAQYTNSRDVTLATVAPGGTIYMQVSNDSLFNGAIWENYAPAKAWELTSGDRLKTVYIRYREESDQATTRIVSAAITLDTRAVIDSIDFSPSGRDFMAGDHIHLKLFAGESNGSASVVVGNNLINIELYDDGREGDAIANDSIYEADYNVANNLEFNNAAVWANFTDQAENNASPVQARENMTVLRAPDSITIFSITAPRGFFDRLELYWSASNADDFAQYQIFRSESANVDSNDFLAGTLGSAAMTTFIDTGLTENTTYYYRVFVVDNSGLRTGSNEVHATTNPDAPPDPATLYPLEPEPDYYQIVTIQWTLPYTPDFMAYKVYSWRTDSGRPDSVLTAVITSQDSMSYLDHPFLDPGIDTINYWYIVYTCDRGGNCTPSNALRVHLIDADPGQVSGVVFADSAMLAITWMASEIPDFGSYRLMRDTLSVPDQSQPIFVTIDQNRTSYQDGNIVRGHTYYYWLSVYDRRGHSSSSFLGSSQW
jgi:fibronectin type 3 domain-containing protein